MSTLAIEQLKNSKFTKEHGLDKNTSVHATFAFSNENIRQYIDLLNIAGGRVATVGSGGEQVFYSVFKDAEEVTLIDANPYAKPMVELKKSAIINMTYDEFMRYWSKDLILNALDTKELLGDISDESRKFFDYLLYEDNDARAIDFRSNIGRVVNLYSFRALLGARFDHGKSHGSEFYDNESSYEALKSKLKNANIIYKTAELSEFGKELDGKYSSILVSNIFDYVSNKYFVDAVAPLIDTNLVSNGTMQMHYEMGMYPKFISAMSNQKGFINRDKISIYRVQDPCTNFDLFEGKTKMRYEGKYPKKLDVELDRVDRFEDLVYVYEKN